MKLGAIGGATLSRAARRAAKAAGAGALAVILAAHVGSPNVFFTGKAGDYDVRVVVRPPEVVPGVARVTVRAPSDVQRVSIRPVYWRAGSKGAPSADELRRMEGAAGGGVFEGSLWLMARGAYTVDVIVEGARGKANVMVPVASVATGRLKMNPALGGLLVLLGVMLCAGLVNIVYKGAGEALVPAGDDLDSVRRSRARRVAAFALPVIAVALLGGARWWDAVDTAYERSMYRPSALAVELRGDTLRLEAADTLWQPPRRPSALVPDHGKLMHLFMVRVGDAGAFAHLHPEPLDSGASPPMKVVVPPLPEGEYHLFGDVVHETGFERTLVGRVTLPASAGGASSTRPATSVAARKAPSRRADPDDAWFIGEASRDNSMRLPDGTTMNLEIEPNGVVRAGVEETFRITVRDRSGKQLPLEPYMGMPGHAVVARVDGTVYVHLHPMGTVTVAAQQAFMARDRGDTTEAGALRLNEHAMHQMPAAGVSAPPLQVEFPYAFPRGGSYRLFVQVKRDGRVLTGAFAIAVAESPEANR